MKSGFRLSKRPIKSLSVTKLLHFFVSWLSSVKSSVNTDYMNHEPDRAKKSGYLLQLNCDVMKSSIWFTSLYPGISCRAVKLLLCVYYYYYYVIHVYLNNLLLLLLLLPEMYGEPITITRNIMKAYYYYYYFPDYYYYYYFYIYYYCWTKETQHK